MNTQPPRFCFNTTKFPILGLLIALLYVLATGSVMAAPPTDKPCKGSKCPPPTPQMDDNHVYWGTDVGTSIFYEYSSRTCELAQLAPDFSSGTYDCQLLAPYVTYNVANMDDAMTWEQLYKRGDQYWCDRPDIFYFIYPDLQYSYSWAGDCTDEIEGCDVTIVNRIGSNNTSANLGSVTFEAFEYGVTTTDPVPFTEEHHFDVDYLQVTKFAPKGKNKVLAICGAVPVPGTLTFHISPVAATPE